MSRKNRDHLAIQPDLECQWVFIVPSDVKYCSEQSSEMLETCTTLFEDFQNFITPTAIDYNLFLFSEDIPVPVENTDTDEKIDMLEQQLEKDLGLESRDLIDSISRSGNHVYWIPFTNFHRNKVQIWLMDRDQKINRNDSCIAYRNGGQLDRKPMLDPLKLDVWHVPTEKGISHSTDFEFQITIQLHSDIWFEKTDIGNTNRKYLRSFFKRIVRDLPVAHVKRSCNWYSTSRLEEIF